MITLDQIVLLESRVQKAVERINQLHQENESLTKKLEAYVTRIGEMESIISQFRDDQGRIEQGILNALNQLDALEDSIDQTQDTGESASVDSLRIQADSVFTSEEEESILSRDSLFSGEYINQDDVVEEDEEAFVLSETNPTSPDITSGSLDSTEEEEPTKEAELDIF